MRNGELADLRPSGAVHRWETGAEKYTLEGWRNRYYYVVRRSGILREEGLKVTSHGLRHQYLQRMFERITGRLAPVKGGGGYDPGLLELAMREVAERAGHSDPYKAGAYLGRLAGARGALADPAQGSSSGGLPAPEVRWPPEQRRPGPIRSWGGQRMRDEMPLAEVQGFGI
jgi:hypothetical protein